MGTNFYTPLGVHIGKRSAAGWYCWNCRTTLCMEGIHAVHMAETEQKWHSACPKCGAEVPNLNFPGTQPEKGPIRPCYSFSWAISPDNIKGHILSDFVTDEYKHRIYPLDKFLEEINKSCPIQFFHLVGEEFS